MLAASTDDVRLSMDCNPFAMMASNSPNSAASLAKLAAMDGSPLTATAEGLGAARMLPTLTEETDDAGVELDRVWVRLDRVWVRLEGVLVGLDRVWVRLESTLVGRVRLLVELDRTVLELDDALVEDVVLRVELERALLELEGALVELTLLLVELALLALWELDDAARAGRTTRKRRQKNATEYILRCDVNKTTRS